MSVTFYGANVDKPITIDVKPVPIRPVSRLTPIPDSEPDGSGCLRPFANQQLNSRLAATTPESFLKIVWQAALSEGLPTLFVLWGANQVLVQREVNWRLFDHKGVPIAFGPQGEGYIVIDTANSLFYSSDPFGLISARELQNGNEKFAMFAAFGKGFRRTVLSRENQRMLILSVELPKITNMALQAPEYTIIESYDLGSPIQMDEERVLTSTRCRATLTARGMPFLTALHGNTLVMAATDHIFLADENLKITNDFQDKFIPLSMSLDEAMRIYLIVRMEEGRHALWILTSEGERLADIEIPAMADDAYTPPVIGYDHRVYIMLGNQVLSISPQGEKLWTRSVPGKIAGAYVTADNQLLVSAGSVVGTFNTQGEFRVLYAFVDETVTTPPLLTKRGSLMVASDRHLYCLKPG